MTAGERKTTNRGFVIYDEIPDMYGGVVRVQESSNIKGGVWLFYDDPKNRVIEDELLARRPAQGIAVPHLSPEQVSRVIVALQAYLDDQNHPAIHAAEAAEEDGA